MVADSIVLCIVEDKIVTSGDCIDGKDETEDVEV